MTARRLVVEADGGSRGNPGLAAYGALVRDGDSGRLLVERAETLGVQTNNVAEYSGLVAGLTAAYGIDPDAEVLVRMDSKLVVEQMSGRWSIKNQALRGLALSAREAFPFERVRYEWIPRERNTDADRLVNLALDAELRGERGVVDRVLSDSPDGLADARPAAVVPGWATDIGEPTTLLVVRHGATDYSLGKKFSGRGGFDAPLADIGRRQAVAVARELVARGGADVVVSSSLLRAQQTAQVLLEALVPLGCEPELEVDPDLAECAFGDWDGLSFAEVQELFPVELASWLGSTDMAPPGGESFSELRDRVDLARRRLLERHRGLRVVVVSHVSPIKVLAGLALDAPLGAIYRMELAPCSLTTLAWWTDGNASMRGWAERTHLHGVDVPDGT